MVFDTALGETVLFGGSGLTGEPLYGDTWIWDGASWTPAPLGGNPSPPARTSHTMAYDTAHSQVVLFGGYTAPATGPQAFPADTWVYGAPTTALTAAQISDISLSASSGVGCVPPLTATPLKGTSGNTDTKLNPYTIPVITVFDHSMADTTGVYAIYGCDGTVTAFTSEFGTGVASPCSHKGYPNAGGTTFGINGHYLGDLTDGTNRTKILNYEGHPGFDYAAHCQLDNQKPPHCTLGTGTTVYAVTSGVIHYPETMVGICAKAGCLHPPYQYHALELIPDSAPYLQVYYLHLSTYGGTTDPTAPIPGADPTCTSPPQTTLPLADGTHVDAGCALAQSGNTSPTYNIGPHLHLEVQRVLPHMMPVSHSNLNCTIDGALKTCVPVDPYGSSCGVDPYFSLIQVRNVPLWNFPSYFSVNALCFGKFPIGTQDQQQVTLTDVAATTLKISSITLGGTSAPDFSETNNCPSTLNPGQSCQFTVTFTPMTTGVRTAMLTIQGNNGSVNLVLVVSGSGT